MIDPQEKLYIDLIILLARLGGGHERRGWEEMGGGGSVIDGKCLPRTYVVFVFLCSVLVGLRSAICIPKVQRVRASRCYIMVCRM